MFKSVASHIRLMITRDQAQYIKDKLPYSYSLISARSKSYQEMSMEELVDFEKGGSYHNQRSFEEELVKFEDQLSEEVEQCDATSAGDNSEDDELIEKLMCKIQGDIITPINEDMEQQSEYEPDKVMEEEDSVCGDLSDEKLAQSYTESLSKKPSSQLISLQQSTQQYSTSTPLNVQSLLPQVQKPAFKKQVRRVRKPRKQQKPPFFQQTTNTDLNNSLSTQQKHYLFILDKVRQNKYSNLFQKPLSPPELEYLGYNLIQQKQMNLSIIQSNILSNKYQHLQQLHRDLLIYWLGSYSFKPNEVVPDASKGDRQLSHKVLKQYLFNNNKKYNNEMSSSPQNPVLSTQVQNQLISKSQRMVLYQQIKSLHPKHLSRIFLMVAVSPSDAEIIFDLQTLPDSKVIQLKSYVQRVNNQKQENRKQMRTERD